MNSKDKRNNKGPEGSGSGSEPAKPGPVVAFRQVRPPQNPKSGAEIIGQDDLVEYGLLNVRVRQLRKDLADAIADRSQKRDQLKARVKMGVTVEPGIHKVWLSAKKNLVVA